MRELQTLTESASILIPHRVILQVDLLLFAFVVNESEGDWYQVLLLALEQECRLWLLQMLLSLLALEDVFVVRIEIRD